MHLKFIIAVLSLFGVLKLTRTKSLFTSTENIDLESFETFSTAVTTAATSSNSDNNKEPKIPTKDPFVNCNKTGEEPDKLDDSKEFLPYIPYIILAVVFLGLVYVVKMFLDFMRFCAKFYNKIPNFLSKETQTNDETSDKQSDQNQSSELKGIQTSDEASDKQPDQNQSSESKEMETEF